MAATMQEFEHFKNPHLKTEENRDQLIGIAAAKGAALALVAGGLIAFSGPRYSKAYQTASPRLKQFVLGTGMFLPSRSFLTFPFLQSVTSANPYVSIARPHC